MKFIVERVSKGGLFSEEKPCVGAKISLVKVLNTIYVDEEHYNFCSRDDRGDYLYLEGGEYPIWIIEATTLEELYKNVGAERIIINWDTNLLLPLDLSVFNGRIRIYDSYVE